VIDLALIIDILASTLLVAAPAIVLNRLMADADGPGIGELFRIPVDPPLPRGVQEEEPVRWRLDRLGSGRHLPEVGARRSPSIVASETPSLRSSC
jgi:hypothetical protein